MLPTSARVAQEVYEPLIGVHYPMLCNVKKDNWQIGARGNDVDHECHTRANVAYSRATDLTVSVCPVNMQGTTGMAQVRSALLHGVCTVYTNDQQTNKASVQGQFPVGSLACSGSGPLVGNVLWWEMSSHRTCPLVGVSLPQHFSTLGQEKASGGKSPVVGTKLWWCLPHLFSNASLSSKLFSPKALLDKGALPRHSCSTRRFFPTTPAPPGVSFPPLLLHKGLLHTVLFPPLLFHMFFFPTTPASQGFASHSSLPTTPVPQVFLSHHSCFTRVCFTQFSSHHSCSTSFFFPTSPAPQGLASHSSLPTTPAPQGFASHSSLPTTPASQRFASHISLPTTPASQRFCFPTTLASQGFAFPPLLLHKGLFTHHSCSTTRAVPQGSASRLSTTPASQKLVSQGFPCTLASQGLITQGPLLLHWSLLHWILPPLLFDKFLLDKVLPGHQSCSTRLRLTILSSTISAGPVCFIALTSGPVWA